MTDRAKRIHEKWIQVRLPRDLADKLRQCAARLQRYYIDHPNETPPWLDDVADVEPSLADTIRMLLFRDDLHAMRGRQPRKNVP
jgi:hypothetical protein